VTSLESASSAKPIKRAASTKIGCHSALLDLVRVIKLLVRKIDRIPLIKSNCRATCGTLAISLPSVSVTGFAKKLSSRLSFMQLGLGVVSIEEIISVTAISASYFEHSYFGGITPSVRSLYASRVQLSYAPDLLALLEEPVPFHSSEL